MNVSRLFVFVMFVVFSVAANSAESTKWQSPESVAGTELVDLQKAKELHNQGVVFIDVRSPRQYSKRHIPGAINLYVKTDFTEQNLLNYVKRESSFVVYCNGVNCSLSYRAASKAVDWGFSGVKYFRVGAKAWRLDGNPLEYGSQ